MLTSDVLTAISLVFFAYAILWGANLYSTAPLPATSNLSLLTVDLLSIVLALSGTVEASTIALIAGYSNLLFLVLGGIQVSRHSELVANSTFFVAITLLLGAATS